MQRIFLVLVALCIPLSLFAIANQQENQVETTGAEVGGVTIPGGVNVGAGGQVGGNTSIGGVTPGQTELLDSPYSVGGTVNTGGVLPEEGEVKSFVKTQEVDGALIITGQGDEKTENVEKISQSGEILTYAEMRTFAEYFVGKDTRIKTLYYKGEDLDITYELNAKVFGMFNKKYELVIHGNTNAHTFTLSKPRWLIFSKSGQKQISKSFSEIVPAAFSEVELKKQNSSTYGTVAYMLEVLNHTMKHSFDVSMGVSE